MCGISGFITSTGDQDENFDILKKMSASICHRGPDSQGFYIKNGVYFAHNRLSIIDLDSGDQPIFNEDKSISIVFNGEIYNYQELKRELLVKGHIFRTNSDTEVIVHLYEEEGVDCLRKLNGMFAFALYDKNKEQVTIARDRMGQKPLVYFYNGKSLYFASELKSLIMHPNVPKDINNMAISYYLKLLYIPSPHTIYQGVKKLQPAHYIQYSSGEISISQYWKPRSNINNSKSIDEWLEDIGYLINDATKIRMMSDVPLGVLLSGGLDSTAIATFMAKNSVKPIHTFSVGFGDEISELPYARTVADQIKSEHVELDISTNIKEDLLKMVDIYDEPFADCSNIPTYLISKKAREHVTVVLTGDGGDELFAGYNGYRDIKYLKYIQKYGKFGRGIKRANEKLFSKFQLDLFDREIETTTEDGLQYWLDFKSQIKDDELRLLLNSNMPNSKESLIDSSWINLRNQDNLSQALNLDMAYYLPDDLHKKVDMASMAVSLESRSPFMDYRLIELAMSIPSHIKIKKNKNKYLLKKLLEKFYSNKFIYRPKMGFGSPITHWVKNELKELVLDKINSNSAINKYLDEVSIMKIKENVMKDKNVETCDTYKLWQLLVLELWLNRA